MTVAEAEAEAARQSYRRSARIVRHVSYDRERRDCNLRDRRMRAWLQGPLRTRATFEEEEKDCMHVTS